MINYIKLYLVIEGYHKYPNAPIEVEFLKYQHRHLFHIKIDLKVDVLDRQFEIFMCEEKLRNLLIENFGSPCNFDNMSCESIANFIYKNFMTDRILNIEVLEDGFGGAGLII